MHKKEEKHNHIHSSNKEEYVTDNAKSQCKSIYTSFKFAFNKMSNLREKRPLLYANED